MKKTTLEIPEEIFRQAKARAALRGIPLRQYVTEALEEKLLAISGKNDPGEEPPWMAGFGALADLAEETSSVEAVIEEAFGQIEPEDCQ